jgi:Tol biopolymer transport system component
MKNHKLTVVQYLGFFIINSSLLISCLPETNNTETLSPKVTDLAIATSTLLPATSVSPTFSLPPTTFTNTPINTLTIVPRRIAFAARDGVVVINTDGTNAITISVKNSAGFDMIYSSPTWSPDGHWLAFIGEELRASEWIYSYSDIYIAKTDGSEVRRLTYSPNIIKGNLSWSPTKNYLLYNAQDASGKQTDLYLINTNNENDNRNITNTATHETYPAWSPDGQKIAFLSPDINNFGHENLYIRNADGTNQQAIAGADAGYGKISWSPDGKQIIYVSPQNCGDIYTVDLESSHLRLVNDMSGHKKSPAWSPDGKQILFSGSSFNCLDGQSTSLFNNWQIYSIDTSNNSYALLFSKQPSEENYDPAWATVPVLKTGENYIVTESGNNLNMRSAPTTKGKILEKLQTGEMISIMEDYADNDGYYWRRVRTLDGLEGWIVELAAWYQAVN